jgi:hypothetical protein
MKTLAFGEGSMKTVNTGTVVHLEKCPFRAFPSRTLCVRLLTERAVSVKARYIISGDKALLRIREYIGIIVLNERAF